MVAVGKKVESVVAIEKKVEPANSSLDCSSVDLGLLVSDGRVRHVQVSFENAEEVLDVVHLQTGWRFAL